MMLYCSPIARRLSSMGLSRMKIAVFTVSGGGAASLRFFFGLERCMGCFPFVLRLMSLRTSTRTAASVPERGQARAQGLGALAIFGDEHPSIVWTGGPRTGMDCYSKRLESHSIHRPART